MVFMLFIFGCARANFWRGARYTLHFSTKSCTRAKCMMVRVMCITVDLVHVVHFHLFAWPADVERTSLLRERRGSIVITEDLFAAVVLVTDSLVHLTSSIHVGTLFPSCAVTAYVL